MADLPGASYEDHLLSVDLMEELLPNQIMLSLATPYPGTVMGNFLKDLEYGSRQKTDQLSYRTFTWILTGFTRS